MDTETLASLAGRFVRLELDDGFVGLVWLNAVDPTWAANELNCDVISVEQWGVRSEPPLDTPMIVAARQVLRAQAMPQD